MINIVKWTIPVLVFFLGIVYRMLFPSTPISASTVTPYSLKSEEAKLSLKHHAEMYGSPDIIKVTDHIHVGIGFALANMIMIEGTDGIIIVDTTESSETCFQIFEKFRKITSKPLKAIVVTHFHADHILGAEALLDAHGDSRNNIEVIMHATTQDELMKFKMLPNVGNVRAHRQFGNLLKQNTEHLDSGIGPQLNIKMKSNLQFVTPTKTFEDEATYTIAGVTFTVIHTPGETDDQISVWIPEWEVVMPADNIYAAFPNLYAIRGNPPRDCQLWYRSLDKIRRLRAKYMVPSHTPPVIGTHEVFDVITHYRDAIQFVHDQTIRLMNKGLDLDEIVESVRLPPALSLHAFLQEFYGKVSWSVRAVYSAHLGWFDGDPVNLNSLTKHERATRMVELLNSDLGDSASGMEKMLEEAKRKLNKSQAHFNATGYVLKQDLQWALEIASMTLKAAETDSREHDQAKAMVVDALKSLAHSTINANARNYYLTYAKELETGLQLSLTREVKTNVIANTPINEIMRLLPYHFIAESCHDQDVLVVIFEFSDLHETHAYTMRHCVLEYNTEPSLIPDNFDAKLTTDSSAFKVILARKRSPLIALATGDMTLQGSLLSLKKFINLLDRD